MKCFKTFISKDKWGIFSQKQSERLNGFREILGEMVVETHISKKASQLFDTNGGWQVLYNLYLCFINLNTPMLNHMPQNHTLLYHKMTFFPI